MNLRPFGDLAVRAYDDIGGSFSRESIKIHARITSRERQECWVPSVEWEKAEEDGLGLIVDPLLSLDEGTARALMDDLWRAGVRPTSYAGEAHISDLRSHLEDTKTVRDRLLDTVLLRAEPGGFVVTDKPVQVGP